jgi:outer membrane protein OmpA-like peptidoglycan-associated protein
MAVRWALKAATITCALISIGWADFNGGGQTAVGRTISGQTHGKARLNIGVAGGLQQSSLFVKGPAAGGYGSVIKPDGGIVYLQDPARLLSSNVFLGIGVTSFLDFALTLPYYYDWAGFDDQRDGGLGDLEVSLKLLYPPPRQRRVFYQSYYVAVTAPTGMAGRGIFPRQLYYYDNDRPTQNLYGSERPTIKPRMAWTFDFGSLAERFQFLMHLNLGGAFSTDYHRSNTATGSLAFEYRPAEMIDLFVDASIESRAQNFTTRFEVQRDPIMVSPGIRINTPAGVHLTLSGDFCVSPKLDTYRTRWEPGYADYRYSTSVMPTYGVQFALGWEGFLTAQDDDRDGIKNDEDRCPRESEDIDGFEDSDGCPDPDNDGDKLLDKADKCPDKAEDADGFSDADGCPEPDNDRDGIDDPLDKCPDVAEDFDGFEDRDGCPDPDNDKDGVLDSVDHCPNDPEDVDKYEDADGCPDIDNDKDGIPDLKDKCPNEPEALNGFEDTDGCPDEKPKAVKEPDIPRQQILRGLQFKSGSVEMTYGSYVYLDPIAQSLLEFTSVEIEIRAHTDGIGKYETNQRLSQLRAEAVRQYLISKGVEPNRIRAVGFGPSSPIADNRTADGRALNRRIEIIRTK